MSTEYGLGLRGFRFKVVLGEWSRSGSAAILRVLRSRSHGGLGLKGMGSHTQVRTLRCLRRGHMAASVRFGSAEFRTFGLRR